jgi:ApbE superfamily uncharacterized protein (UPF0280 family)
MRGIATSCAVTKNTGGHTSSLGITEAVTVLARLWPLLHTACKTQLGVTREDRFGSTD